MKAKPRKSKKAAVCPCCCKPREVADLLLQVVAIGEHGAAPWRAEPGWTYVELAKLNMLRWACRECLHSKRAIEAHPWRQTFSLGTPYLAYFDQVKRCKDCGSDFTFSATEQLYWYEQLKFWVQSHPKQCAACRRTRRRRVLAQQELEAVLKDLDPKDPAQLANASAKALAAGSRRKAAEFLRRAKNLARDEALRSQLIQQLESLEKD